MGILVDSGRVADVYRYLSENTIFHFLKPRKITAIWCVRSW